VKSWRPTPASVLSATSGPSRSKLCNVTDVAPMRTRLELERVEDPKRDPRQGYGHGFMHGPWDPWTPARVGYEGGVGSSITLAQEVRLASYFREMGCDIDE
jgi:hypothetical protein